MNAAEYRRWAGRKLDRKSDLHKRIFAALKEAGVEEEMRHQVQEAATGKRSLMEFTNGDAYKLLKHLGTARRAATGAEKNVGARRAVPKSDSIIEIATAEQLAKIRLFAYNDLGWRLGWNDGLTECESISKIILKHTKGRKSQIRLLTKSEAWSVIEALKKIKERKSSTKDTKGHEG